MSKQDTPENSLRALRGIVQRGQYAKVAGTTTDVTNARAILAVHDALSAENQIKLLSFPSPKMVKIAWKLVSGSRKS